MLSGVTKNQILDIMCTAWRWKDKKCISVSSNRNLNVIREELSLLIDQQSKVYARHENEGGEIAERGECEVAVPLS